jgi:hypothetical protein
MPRKLTLAILLVLLPVLLLVMGCQSATSVSTVWKTPETLPPPFSKVITLVVNATPAERRAAEDELVRYLRPGEGVASYSVISDEDLKNEKAVRQVIQSSGIDGAVVMRLVARDQQSIYHPPAYQPNYSFSEYYGRFGYDDADASYSPGYTVTDTIIYTEISVYAVKDAKLLWAGAGATSNPANIKDLALQTAKSAAAELKKQGLIR